MPGAGYKVNRKQGAAWRKSRGPGRLRLKNQVIGVDTYPGRTAREWFEYNKGRMWTFIKNTDGTVDRVHTGFMNVIEDGVHV